MNERLVADWLTKAGERGGLDVAFSQLLLSEGYRILRAGHSPTEAGKDIIAVAPNGEIRAYQVKSGDIGLKEFEKIQNQVTTLVEAAIIHPSVPRGSQHHPFLVTTGSFSVPVETTVDGLNDSWKRRGYAPLTLIRGTELQPKFVALAADFWPEEPPETRKFLALYLSNGTGDFDREGYAEFLRHLLPENNLTKPAVVRRISAAGLFASYLLNSFERQGDHWSAFCGWTITAAYQSWAAETYKLGVKMWHSSFLLTRGAALLALERLVKEALADHALTPREPELDDYTRMRNTTAAGSISAWLLIQHRLKQDSERAKPTLRLLQKLACEGRIWFWGESALPSFLAISWALEHGDPSCIGEEILLKVLDLVTKYNRKQSDKPLPGPDVLPDDVLSKQIETIRFPQPRRGRRAPVSWSLDALIHLLALRMRRQALKARWYEISHVDMVSFRAKRPADALLWAGAEGEEMERLPGKPQSWRELVSAAQANDLTRLPAVLRDDPDFALMFSLVYPHRCSTVIVKALDTWFE